MKLYGTITSERASKGQGGNEYLDILIRDEEARIIANISVYPKDDGVANRITLTDAIEWDIDTVAEIKRPQTWEELEKGKKQRGGKYTVVNYTNKEERVMFGSLEEAKNFAEETNGEIEKGKKQKDENDCDLSCTYGHMCKGVGCKLDCPHDCKDN